MDLFSVSPAGKVKKAARLLADARPLMEKDAISARRKLEESLALLQSVPPETPARTGTLTVSLLALARLERLASNHPRAVQLLEQALDLRTGLSEDDRNYLVIEYARAGRTDARAIDQYLAYISLRTLDASAGPSGMVYDLLDQCCRLDENTPAEEVSDRLAFCAKIIAADGRLGQPYYYRARHAFNSGNYAAAIKDLTQAMDRGVSHAQLPYLMHLCSGYQSKSDGSLDQAAHHFVEAARQNSSCFTANFEAGKCLIELCRKGADGPEVPENVAASRRAYAIALLERACVINDRSAIAHYTLGQAYFLERSAEKAAAALGKAARLQPSTPYHYEHARALRRCGSLKEAFTAGELALNLEPGNVKVQWLASSLSLQLHDFERASRGFRQLIAELPPEHTLHRNALHGLGVCAFEAGDFQGAISSFEALQAQDLELTPEGRLMLARGYLRTNALDQAATLLTDLTASGTLKGDALYFLGCCRAKQGRCEDAVSVLAAAESAGAPADKCGEQRGLAHEALGRVDAARRDYACVLHLGESPPVRFRLGLLCWKAGEHEEALTHLRRAEQTPETLAAQAELSELIGDGAECTRLFELALASAPDNPAIGRRFGASLLRMGEIKQAIKVLDSVSATASANARSVASVLSDSNSIASANDADSATVYQLGLAHLVAGEPDEAIAVWKKLPLTPEAETAISIAAIYAARQAHDRGEYDQSLTYWNQAVRNGTTDRSQKKQLAIATAAAALRSAASGGSVEDWSEKLQRAQELDPDDEAIDILSAARDLVEGSTADSETMLTRIATNGTIENRATAQYLLGVAKLRALDAIGALTHLRAAFCEGNPDIQHAARLPYSFALAHSGRCSDAADILGGCFEDPAR